MILILAVYIALLSFSVSKLAGNKQKRWISSGYITAFLLTILVYFTVLNIVGSTSGDGISGSVAGMVYAFATFITGLVFLYIGYTSKKHIKSSNSK